MHDGNKRLWSFSFDKNTNTADNTKSLEELLVILFNYIHICGLDTSHNGRFIDFPTIRQTRYVDKLMYWEGL